MFKKEAIKEWVDAVKILSKESGFNSNHVIIIVDSGKVEGLVYKGMFDYAALGYTDGTGYWVNLDDFLKSIKFVDFESCRKKFLDDSTIELSDKGKRVKIPILNKDNFCLDLWSNGLSVNIDDASIFKLAKYFNFGLGNNVIVVEGNNNYQGFIGFAGVIDVEGIQGNVWVPDKVINLIHKLKYERMVLGELECRFERNGIEIGVCNLVDMGDFDEKIRRFDKNFDEFWNKGILSFVDESLDMLLESVGNIPNLSNTSDVSIKINDKTLIFTKKEGVEFNCEFEHGKDFTGSLNLVISSLSLFLLKALRSEIQEIRFSDEVLLGKGEKARISFSYLSSNF